MFSYDNEFIQIKLKTGNVSVKTSQLCKYSQLAQDNMSVFNRTYILSDLIEKFQNEHHVNDLNFKIFIKIINDEQIQIDKNNFNDLDTLNQFFKADIVANTLKDFLFKHSSDIDLIIDLLNEHQKLLDENAIENDDICCFIEKCLTNNIEKCLKNENFNKLPISSLYRIIQNSNNHISDILIDFINKSIQDRYILFDYLNPEFLSDKKFDKLYNDYINSKGKTAENYYQSINKDLIYMKKLKEMKNENENLQNQIKLLKKEKQDLITQNSYLEVNQELLKKEYKDAKEKEQNDDFNIITKIIVPQFSNDLLLSIACGKGNFKLVKYFVSTGIYSLSNDHAFCLQCACSSGNIDLVKYIIQYNINSLTSRTVFILIIVNSIS